MTGILFYGALGLGLTCMAWLIKGETAVMYGGFTRRRALNAAVLLCLFTVMTGVAALRIDVGNDYGNYVNTFHEIYVGGYVVTEPGFNLAVRLVYLLAGGENYLLVFGLFAAATSFLFLKAMYEQSVDFAFSFTLFMLLGLYFRTFNTVRYYLVLAVALYSLRYVLRKEYGKFVLLIGGASLFHKSVLVVIPLYLIAALPWKKWQIGLGAVFAASVPLFRDFWMELALRLYPSYQNTIYLEKDVGLGESLAAILRCAAVLALAAAVWREAVEKNRANLFYLKLNLLGLAVYLCASFLPLVTRIGYYLITPHILLVPGLLAGLPPGRKRKLAYGAVFLFALASFAYFLLTASGEGVRVLPYHTWIFTEKEWLNGSYIF